MSDYHIFEAVFPRPEHYKEVITDFVNNFNKDLDYKSDSYVAYTDYLYKEEPMIYFDYDGDELTPHEETCLPVTSTTGNQTFYLGLNDYKFLKSFPKTLYPLLQQLPIIIKMKAPPIFWNAAGAFRIGRFYDLYHVYWLEEDESKEKSIVKTWYVNYQDLRGFEKILNGTEYSYILGDTWEIGDWIANNVPLAEEFVFVRWLTEEEFINHCNI